MVESPAIQILTFLAAGVAVGGVLGLAHGDGAPVHVVPLNVNDAGTGLLPVWLPLKPKLTEAPAATALL
jgi:hypothetical protein